MTIDANIVIAYLAGDTPVVQALSKWKEGGASLFLPAVAESEVLSYSNWTIEEQRATEKFLVDTFASISFDRSIAKVAAAIRRQTKMKFPDAAIAATALYTHAPVVTRNQRDFQRVPGLRIISL